MPLGLTSVSLGASSSLRHVQQLCVPVTVKTTILTQSHMI